MVASITSRTSCGAEGITRAAVRRIFSSSAIRFVLVCKRPAVSTITQSILRARAAVKASNTTALGSEPGCCRIRSAPVRCAHTSSCSMAAARNVSAAHSMTLRPSDWMRRASFPMEVVLPAPLTPTTMITAGGSLTWGSGRSVACRISRRCSRIRTFNSLMSPVIWRSMRWRIRSRISEVVFAPMSAVISAYSNSSRTSASISLRPLTASSSFSIRPVRVFWMPAFRRSKRFGSLELEDPKRDLIMGALKPSVYQRPLD